MRNLLRLMLVSLLAITSVSAGSIQYEVTPLGGDSYRYDYSISGISFQSNQVLDIRFDPLLYGSLSNAVVPVGFIDLLLQPNNPPGEMGDYKALALFDNLSAAGTFSVELTYLGSGQPGAQPFFLMQYDAQGFYQYTMDGGMTLADPTPTPEPSAMPIVAMALLSGGLFVHRRRVRRPPQKA